MQFEITARPPMMAIDPALIANQTSMTKALVLCQTLSGLPDAQFYGEGGIVKHQAQWSRIMSENSEHNFPHDKFNVYMDKAGNEAPMLWLLHSRGYDIGKLHLRETETERLLRLERQDNERLRAERRLLMEAIGGRVVA
jgi:hypothetical protein